MAHEPQFKEVFKTFNPADIAFIKSLLEDNGVVYYINNENVTSVGNLMFAEPMRVMVEDSQYESVKELLAQFQGNFGTFAPRDDGIVDEEDEEEKK